LGTRRLLVALNRSLATEDVAIAWPRIAGHAVLRQPDPRRDCP
jgi:hypothetical protein